MESIFLGISFIVVILIILIPITNLYSAINTTLEVITAKNKIKLKEYKKIDKSMF